MVNWNIISLDNWERGRKVQPKCQRHEANWEVEKEGNKDTARPMLTFVQARDTLITKVILNTRAFTSLRVQKKIVEKATFPCAKCRGVGTDALLRTRCAVCFGKGKVSIGKPAITCTYCGGRGTQHPNERLTTCIVCNGKGMVSIMEPVRKCTFCRGTGKDTKFNSYCGICKGKGVVTMGVTGLAL